MAAADFRFADLYNRRQRVGFAAGQLVRRHHGDHLLHARDGGQRSGLQLGLVADDADHRAVCAAAEVRVQPERLDAIDHVVDLLVRCRLLSG